MRRGEIFRYVLCLYSLAKRQLSNIGILRPGGIKLGAGGLIRAYGAAARQVLKEAPHSAIVPRSTFRISGSVSLIGSIYDCIAKVGGTTSDETYGDDGNFAITVICSSDVAEELRVRLADATRGEIKVQDI